MYVPRIKLGTAFVPAGLLCTSKVIVRTFSFFSVFSEAAGFSVFFSVFISAFDSGAAVFSNSAGAVASGFGSGLGSGCGGAGFAFFSSSA